MVIKHRISFGLKTSITPADEKCDGNRDYPIRMRITYGGNRVDYPILLSVPKQFWDSAAQFAKPGSVSYRGISASEINATISDYRSLVEEIFKSYELQKLIPSTSMLRDSIKQSYEKKFINLAGGKSNSLSLSEAFKSFMNERGTNNAWTEASYEKFNALWSDLAEFKSSISFSDFTEDGLTDFMIFLREKKVIRPEKRDSKGKILQEAEIGLKNSTIGKKLDFLKWFLKWATEKGYNKCLDYQSFKPKLKSTNNSVVFLTEQEIQKICDFDIPRDKSHLEKVRDGLILCCYTSLRFSDLQNLKKSDVHGDVINVTTIKTADTIRIDLNNVSRQILDKYKDMPIPNGKALPVISNQKMNEGIKELCMLAGIDEPITKVYYKANERIEETRPKYEFISTHTGRRSFICNALAKGMPVNVVMKFTGHEEYKTMKPYIDVVDSIKGKEMAKMNSDAIVIK